jgi:hypothetical protein
LFLRRGATTWAVGGNPQFHHDGWFWRIFEIFGFRPSNDLEAELMIEFNYGAIALPMVCHDASESVMTGIRNLPALQQVADA